MCTDKAQVSSIASAFFIGNAFTVLWLPRLSDKSGRKLFYGGGVIFDFILFSAIFFINNIYAMIGLMFCFGASNVLRTQIGWVYMMELSPKKQ